MPLFPTSSVRNLGLLALLFFASQVATSPSRVGFYESEQHPFRSTSVLGGLNHPWALAELPDGRILVTEQSGRLLLVQTGRSPVEVAGGPAVWAKGQGGLLDIVLHPKFQQNHLVYLSFSKPSNDGVEATVAVYRGSLVAGELTEGKTVFIADAWSSGTIHFGGRLMFGSSGDLFLTVGDRGGSVGSPTERMSEADLRNHPAQSLTTDLGKVLRIHDDGEVPADNPFVQRAGARPEIWSLGLANPQGLCFDWLTSSVLATDHGLQGGDEINVLGPGLNFGWPVTGRGVHYGSVVPVYVHVGPLAPGMEDSMYSWDGSIGPSSVLAYSGEAFPRWRGSLLVGGLVSRAVHRLRLDGTKVVHEEKLLTGTGKVRELVQASNGAIYVLFDTSSEEANSLVRLEPITRPRSH